MIRKFKSSLTALGGLALSIAAGSVQANEALTFTLNWAAKADHAAYYYAKEQGWYAAAGLDVTIEPGRGSGATVQRVAAGASNMGVADFSTMLAARGKGANLVGVMSIYSSAPVYFYWLKSSGISGPKDFAGKTIGAPAGDVAVSLWPVFAAKAGIDPKSVRFVNMAPAAKLSALKSKTVELIPYLYDAHDLVIDELGDSVQFIGTDSYGINPYGLMVFVNGAYLEKNRAAVGNFVRASQRAFSFCTKNFAPCLAALQKATSGLNEAFERKSWERMKTLMNDAKTREIAFGWIDPDRVKNDYDLVAQTVGITTPFDPKAAITDDFLDKNVKFDPSTIRVSK